LSREVSRRLRDVSLAISLDEIRNIPSVSNHSVQQAPLRYAKR
jgi:hypothetical protein